MVGSLEYRINLFSVQGFEHVGAAHQLSHRLAATGNDQTLTCCDSINYVAAMVTKITNRHFCHGSMVSRVIHAEEPAAAEDWNVVADVARNAKRRHVQIGPVGPLGDPMDPTLRTHANSLGRGDPVLDPVQQVDIRTQFRVGEHAHPVLLVAMNDRPDLLDHGQSGGRDLD